jgi:transcriptional regulator with XRE-family HTH domain
LSGAPRAPYQPPSGLLVHPSSQRQLVDGAAVDFTYISTLENGRVPAPSAETIVRLSGSLSCPPEDLLAGRSVICSLWNVSDDAGTVALMTALYAGPKAGRSAPEALRDAQRVRIGAGGPPYLWAPFILLGR